MIRYPLLIVIAFSTLCVLASLIIQTQVSSISLMQSVIVDTNTTLHQNREDIVAIREILKSPATRQCLERRK